MNPTQSLVALLKALKECIDSSTVRESEVDALLAKLERGEWVVVPGEIDRSLHGGVVMAWNRCMVEHETLEMTWPKLVEAISAAKEP